MSLVCRHVIASSYAVEHLVAKNPKCVSSQLGIRFLNFNQQRLGCSTPNPFEASLSIKLQEFTTTSVSSHPAFQRRIPRIVAFGRRSLLYDETDTYVLLEPGEEEVFVNEEELRERLKSWLVKWPGNQLPEDLARFDSLDEVVSFLVNSACELDLGGGLGSVQWYEVRLE
ncbi:hypothetical protein R1flu_019046 [Riccia fluitans]|uniref:Chlororespiratory reduction 7 n=1 Tax=Riccia fluitans TaxID=41844 RepID=A0ABD1ZHK5_9MARC